MSKEQDRTSELLRRIEEGTTAVFQSEEYKKYLRTMSNFHHYSFRNSLLIYLQNPDASLVAGYNAWQRVNRYVARGEKGIEIVAYAPKTIWVNEPTLDGEGKPVLDEHGKQVYEKRREKIPAYKPVYVFDVSQTRGEPLPDFGPRTLEAEVDNLDVIMAALQRISPLPIHIEPIPDSDARGFCSFSEQKIVVREGMPPAQTLKTAVHELAHAIMHDPASEARPDQRTREVEAESVAFIVCSHLGLDTSDYTFPYLAGWSSSQELEQLHASLDRIQHMADVLIQQFDARILELQREAPAQEAEKTAALDEIETPAKDQHHTEPSAIPSRAPENAVSDAKKPQPERYNREQIERAASTDLEAWLANQGEKLLKSGREQRLDRDHSVTVRGNQWYDHSRQQGGNAITFVQNYYNLTFPEAVKRLLDGEPATFSPTDRPEAPQRIFQAPERNTDMRRVFAYLTITREIDPEVVRAFAKAGTLYEDAKRHNAIFLGRDEDGVSRHAHARSTNTEGQSFKLNLEGSDARYSFHHIGSSPELYVFEAPIDMLSYISLHPDNWQQHSYVACCGLSTKAMQQILSTHPEIRSVHLCLDNDEAGRGAVERMTGELSPIGYTVLRESSVYKDWNEDLIATRFYEAQKSERSESMMPPPKTQALFENVDSETLNRHFSSFVGFTLSSPAAWFEFYHYDPETKQMTIREWWGPNNYFEFTQAPAEIAEKSLFSETLKKEFLDPSFICREGEHYERSPFLADHEKEHNKAAEAWDDTVRFDGEIDLDKERSRENLGFRDHDPPAPAAQKRPSLMERIAAAEKEAARRNAERAAARTQDTPKRERGE